MFFQVRKKLFYKFGFEIKMLTYLAVRKILCINMNVAQFSNYFQI